MRLFLAVFFSATASCSGLAECDANADETSMLQVSRHNTARAELLALQQQVHQLSELEANQLQLMGDFVVWVGGNQLKAVQSLPQSLQEFASVQGYVAAMTRAQKIGAQLQLSASSALDIQGQSQAVQSVRSFLETYRVVLQETSQVAGDFPTEDANTGILAQWCPGMQLMAQHVSDKFQTDGIDTNTNALSSVSLGDQDGDLHNVASLLQGVDMKNLQTQELSEEQTVALKQQLQMALNGLTTQEVFIKSLGDAFVTYCSEDIANNCPPIHYPILSGPIRNMVDRCVDIFGQVTALGNLADGSVSQQVAAH